MKTKRYVITGGPGIGKTTVINLLGSRGHRVTHEIARRVIEEQQAIGGEALPWRNLALFQEVVVERQLLLENECEEETTFHDRGIIDGHGYSRHGGVETPAMIRQLGRCRYDKVFILDPLPVYVNDAERREDKEEALRIHQAIIRAYQEFGYTPVMVPVLEPEARVDLILSHL